MLVFFFLSLHGLFSLSLSLKLGNLTPPSVSILLSTTFISNLN